MFNEALHFTFKKWCTFTAQINKFGMQLWNKLAKFYGWKASCTEELEPLFSIAQVLSSIQALNLNSYFAESSVKQTENTEVKLKHDPREERKRKNWNIRSVCLLVRRFTLASDERTNVF